MLPLVIFFSVFEYLRDFFLLYWRGYRIVRADEQKPTTDKPLESKPEEKLPEQASA